jgi:hypothetical protein
MSGLNRAVVAGLTRVVAGGSASPQPRRSLGEEAATLQPGAVEPDGVAIFTPSAVAGREHARRAPEWLRYRVRVRIARRPRPSDNGPTRDRASPRSDGDSAIGIRTAATVRRADVAGTGDLVPHGRGRMA